MHKTGTFDIYIPDTSNRLNFGFVPVFRIGELHEFEGRHFDSGSQNRRKGNFVNNNNGNHSGLFIPAESLRDRAEKNNRGENEREYIDFEQFHAFNALFRQFQFLDTLVYEPEGERKNYGSGEIEKISA